MKLALPKDPYSMMFAPREILEHKELLFELYMMNKGCYDFIAKKFRSELDELNKKAPS